MPAAGKDPQKPGLLRRVAPFAADLSDHWDLLRQFTLRNFELTLRGSHLGLIWSFLNPVLILGLYVYVFGYIFRGSFGVIPKETSADYALAIFMGLAFLNFISESMSAAPSVITGNPNFVKKVIFPLEILPAATAGASFLRMLIVLSLTLSGAALWGRGVHLGWLWLIALVPPFCLFVLGVTWLFAALGVFVRDLAQLVAFLSIALMYASAVFYPPSRMSPAVWHIMRFNPLLLVIDLARNAVLWQRSVNLRELAYVYVSCAATAYLGHWCFCRMRPAFADVI
jgi:lipopolysaccharide transport system permease protein